MRFLLGFGVGVVLGLIFAPAGGEETRQRLANKAREWTHAPEQKMQAKLEEVAERSQQKAGEVGSEIGRKVAENAVRAVTNQVLGRDKEQSA